MNINLQQRIHPILQVVIVIGLIIFLIIFLSGISWLQSHSADIIQLRQSNFGQELLSYFALIWTLLTGIVIYGLVFMVNDIKNTIKKSKTEGTK